MTQLTLTAIPSPCINICKMNEASGLCEGCWRTLDEIIAWSTASNEVKSDLWGKIEQRQQDQFKAV